MRVMVIVKATKETEALVMPSRQLLEEMGKFNEQLVKAGVMLDGAGLKPSSQGARVRFEGEGAQKRSVIDGPFTESKELIAGYWLWQVKDLAEAIEWVKRCPHPHPGSGGRRPRLRSARSSRSRTSWRSRRRVGLSIPSPVPPACCSEQVGAARRSRPHRRAEAGGASRTMLLSLRGRYFACALTQAA